MVTRVRRYMYATPIVPRDKCLYFGTKVYLYVVTGTTAGDPSVCIKTVACRNPRQSPLLSDVEHIGFSVQHSALDP